MKLGYLVPEFPSQTHAFFWREVLALRALGNEVQLFSTRRPAEDACRHAFAGEARSQTRYLFPPRWVGGLWALATLPFRAARAVIYVLGLRETPPARRVVLMGLLLPAIELRAYAREMGLDHVHVHSCANAAHVAALCRLLGGPPYSLTLHGDLPVYGKDHRQKMRAAAFVACVTKPLQRQVCEVVGLPAERVPVLWMGVDTQRFVDAGLRQPTRNRLHVLTVARLNAAKGHRFALEAVRQLCDLGLDIKYSIAGEGPERSNIEREITRLALQDRVQMLGTRSEDEVLSLLQRADGLLLPSFGSGEAAPVSVMEAMACGLPVVCSQIGGTADMIADGESGYLVPQKDVAAISDRLFVLASDLTLRARIGSAARHQAVNLFDCKALADRMLSLIETTKVGVE